MTLNSTKPRNWRRYFGYRPPVFTAGRRDDTALRRIEGEYIAWLAHERGWDAATAAGYAHSQDKRTLVRTEHVGSDECQKAPARAAPLWAWRLPKRNAELVVSAKLRIVCDDRELLPAIRRQIAAGVAAQILDRAGRALGAYELRI